MHADNSRNNKCCGVVIVTEGETELLVQDVVSILQYLCDKLRRAPMVPTARLIHPLLLDGILSLLCNVPTSVRNNSQFVRLIWLVLK